MTDYVVREEVWPLTLQEVGIAARRGTGELQADVGLGDQGELIYTFSGGTLDQRGLLLVPTPRFDEQEALIGLNWSCMRHDVDQKVLPDGCRRVSP